MKKVILFGGSFDPIHQGHLEIARKAAHSLGGDVWFIPTGISPFKHAVTDYDVRFNLVRSMIKPYKNLLVKDVEKNMPQPSYTVDTVRTLKMRYPDTYFYWLIGSDQLIALDRWKDIEILNTLVEFVVYPRPGFDEPHQYRTLNGLKYDVSSTQIRNGNSFETSREVLTQMMSQGVYLESMTAQRLSDARYQHTLRVTALALEISAVHGLDANRVRLAAMCHDWCKEWSKEDLERAMRASGYQGLNLHPALYHGFAAASVLSKQYYIKDRAVLRAIRSHVTGASTHPLGMVLYIADKCERGRDYDSEDLIALSKQDLRRGFQAVKRLSEAYVRRKNGITRNY